jgi:hypothetical protein
MDQETNTQKRETLKFTVLSVLIVLVVCFLTGVIVLR